MSRWARHFRVALLLLLPAGCASVGPVRFRAPPDQPTPLESQAIDPEASATTPTAQSPAPPATASTSRAEHDAETRKLIDFELRDASPEEREEWLAVLRDAEPAQVGPILRARRQQMINAQEKLARAVSQTQVVPAGHAENEPDENAATARDEDALPSIHPAGGESRGPAADAGSTSWQKRILALAEAPFGKGTAQPAADAAGKGDRGSFGMPQRVGIAGRQPPASLAPDASDAPAAAQADARTSPGNELRVAPGAAVWEDEMHKLISLLEAETSALAARPRSDSQRGDIRTQVALRMLCLISDDPQRSQQPIVGVSPAEQEFWSELLLGLGEYLDVNNVADPGARATQAIAQLKSAAYHLQQTARLQLRNVAFCESIQQFGSYEPFEENSFAPGASVLVYAEIRNFESQPTIDGFYRTSIKSTIEIQRSGPDAQLIDRNVFKPTEDLCRTLRTDYFHSYRIDVPPHLTPGPHLLKLTIVDEISGKTATETLTFVVK